MHGRRRSGTATAGTRAGGSARWRGRPPAIPSEQRGVGWWRRWRRTPAASWAACRRSGPPWLRRVPEHVRHPTLGGCRLRTGGGGGGGRRRRRRARGRRGHCRRPAGGGEGCLCSSVVSSRLGARVRPRLWRGRPPPHPHSGMGGVLGPACVPGCGGGGGAGGGGGGRGACTQRRRLLRRRRRSRRRAQPPPPPLPRAPPPPTTRRRLRRRWRRAGCCSSSPPPPPRRRCFPDEAAAGLVVCAAWGAPHPLPPAAPAAGEGGHNPVRRWGRGGGAAVRGVRPLPPSLGPAALLPIFAAAPRGGGRCRGVAAKRCRRRSPPPLPLLLSLTSPLRSPPPLWRATRGTRPTRDSPHPKPLPPPHLPTPPPFTLMWSGIAHRTPAPAPPPWPQPGDDAGVDGGGGRR